MLLNVVMIFPKYSLATDQDADKGTTVNWGGYETALSAGWTKKRRF